jgi:cellobiose phosphorylase
MQQRLYYGEKLGARQQQAPQFNLQAKGSRENGGFWYSLNAPVIVGVSQFNKEEAWKLFRNMTFNNYAKQFPDF